MSRVESPTPSSLLPAAVGAAFGLGSLAAAVLARLWVAAFPWALRSIQVALVVAIVASALLLGLCLVQVVVWARRAWAAERLSWWAHAASYPVLLVALVGFCSAAALVATGEPGQSLALGGALLAMLAQAVGATQYLRRSGPPGTVGAHLRRWQERTNARADVAADAEADAARDAAAPAAGGPQRGVKR